jgi:hypothetical protein
MASAGAILLPGWGAARGGAIPPAPSPVPGAAAVGSPVSTPPVTPPAGGRLVEEVAAVVRPRAGEARIITLTKVAEEGRIALVAHGGLDAAFRPLDGAALRASLEYFIDQLLLHEEAVRLNIFEVDRADAEAELARFQAVFARPEDFRAFLRSLDITEEELLVTLRRTLRVRRYLESRLGRSRPGEAEAEAWYRAHAAEFGSLPYSAVKDAVASRMADERADAETKSVLADLRARADIRILTSFAPGG